MMSLTAMPRTFEPFEPAFASEVTDTIARLIGAPNEVLLIGGPAGLGDALRARGWQVVRVAAEREATRPAVGEQISVGDLDRVDWLKPFAAERFQAIVIVGLLEFARDPAATLRALRRILASQGHVVALIPNIAHGDLRLALLSGRFPYAEWDQPERLPLRFYTAESVGDLFATAGFEIRNFWRRAAEISPATVLGQSTAASAELIDSLAKDPEARTSHFVVLARPIIQEHDDSDSRDDDEQALAQSRLEARIAELAAQLEALAAQVTLIEQRSQDRLLGDQRRDATPPDTRILEGLATLKSALATLSEAAPAWWQNRRTSESRQVMQYHRLIHRIRGIVRAVLPPGAVVLVVSRGDDALLAFDGRTGQHFPMHDDGAYAGHHPADSAEAIRHLTELRARGAEFLLIPCTASWWLDYYADFAEYLERRHRVVARGDEFGVIFGLQEG